jgi:DNA-binding response OmpR family regulator
MRILLVEDEPAIAQFIRQGLTEANYTVDVVGDGSDALDYALATEYDAIVLDILLPHLDGLQILQALRARGKTTPILLLTARDTVEDRVRGLDHGADDYLVKPFAFAELLARVRALLRRPPLQANAILRVADLELDPARQQARRGAQRLDLSPREYQLLEFLMRHPDQVLTRTQIIEHLWDVDSYVESNVVDVYIGYLRRKIDRAGNRPLIHTVRGIGYRMSEDADE